MREIEQEMDEALRERLVGSEPFDLDRPQQEMVERAYESYFDDERHEEQDLWQQIKGEIMRGGRASRAFQFPIGARVASRGAITC